MQLTNTLLSEEQKQFQGEYGLLVASAAWRLDDFQKIITSWTQSNELDGEMVRGLMLLEGATVSSVHADPISLDLTICFDDRYRLKVFCDQTSEGDDNYTIFIGGRCYGVEGKSQIVCE